MFAPKEPVFIGPSDEEKLEAEMPAIIKQGSAQDSEEDDFVAQIQAAMNEDEDKEEAPPQKMSWSQFNAHTSAHQAQWGDKVFDTCVLCRQHREAMGMWGAEKTKQKVKGEAVGYGMLTEQAKIDLQAAMIRQVRFMKEDRVVVTFIDCDFEQVWISRECRICLAVTIPLVLWVKGSSTVEGGLLDLY